MKQKVFWIFFNIISVVNFTILFIFTAPAYSQNSVNFSSINQKQNITYKIISSADNTFGYDIFQNGKIFIHQMNIPSLPGNTGFKSKEQARKCALIVIDKINRNMMPPSVTRQELDSFLTIKQLKK